MDNDPMMPTIDPITRLPWSVALRPEGAAWIARAEIHAVCVQVSGLGTLMDVFGYRAGHSILAQVGRLLKMQLDERDLLGRHSGDAFLILTQRPYDEIKVLLNHIRDRVFTLSIETAEGRVPEGRFGVAGTDPVASAADAYAALDALIISAEIALQSREQGKTAAEAPPAAPDLGVTAPPAPVAAEEAEAPTPVVVQEVEPQVLEAPSPKPVEVLPPAPKPVEVPVPTVAPVEPVEATPPAAEAHVPAPVFEGVSETSGVGAPTVEAPREEVILAKPEVVEPKVEEPAPPIEAVAPKAVAPKAETEASGAPPQGEAHRVSLVRWNLAEGGQSATVEVEVQYGDKHAVGRVVGRNAPDRIPYLVGEATARALTELLPQGYGVILQDIQSVAHGEHQALWVAVMLMSPAGEEKLLGIAPGNENRYAGTARAVLNAINRRLSLVLNQVSKPSTDAS